MYLQKSHWRYAVITFFVGIFIAYVVHAIFLSYRFTPDPWLTGDWLINYQGGFVRRGLAGEVFFKIAQLTGANQVLLIVGFQILMYLILLINTNRLAVHSSFSALTTAIIFSPAFVLFPALDPQGGFRKEIIFLALYSALSSHLVFSKKVHGRLPLLLGLASILLIPSHEMLVVYLPYLICPIILYEKGLGEMSKKVIIAILPAVLVAILLAIFSKPDADTVTKICNSLAIAPRDCSNPEVQGAISFLKQDLVAAHQFVLSSINREAIIIYVITAALSFLPLALAFFDRQNASFQNKPTRFWLAACILSSILGSLPLFLIAADYGRLIHIHIASLSLLALTARKDENNAAIRLDFKQAIAWVIAIGYVSSWRLIHWNPEYGFAFPLAKLFMRVIFH